MRFEAAAAQPSAFVCSSIISASVPLCGIVLRNCFYPLTSQSHPDKTTDETEEKCHGHDHEHHQSLLVAPWRAKHQPSANANHEITTYASHD
jgi:hypothetical protein